MMKQYRKGSRKKCKIAYRKIYLTSLPMLPAWTIGNEATDTEASDGHGDRKQ